MRTLAPLLFVPVLLLAASFRGAPAPEPGPSSGLGPAAIEAQVAAGQPSTLSSPGPAGHALVSRVSLVPRQEYPATLVPAEAQELSLWPRSAFGPLVFEEVLAHGSTVSEGAVVARLASTALAARVSAADRAADDAALTLRAATERGELAVAAEGVALADAERAVTEAREDLLRWKDEELPDLVRGDTLALRRRQHSIDDAQDELTQLELMYADDELVQATEEIVLRRSRRDLAQQRDEFQLAERRSARAAALRGRTTAARERAVAAAEADLVQLRVEQGLAAAERAQAMAAASAAAAEARRSHADLNADLAACTLRAPRAGVLLHGSLEGWARGSVGAHVRGGLAPTRAGLFVVADPDRLAAVLAIPAADRALAPSGAGATLQVAGRSRAEVGRLEVRRYADTDGSLAARVVLDGPLVGATAGTPATVVVAGAEREVLVLPAPAVHGADGDRWCWVAGAEPGDYRRVAVEVTERHGDDLVVEGDLSEGARVLLAEE